MATDENNHKKEARDDWTGCTFRVERGPSSEGRAWGMADILDEFVRGSSSPLDLTSGGLARGLHAPPGPNGLLRGRHVPPALLPPHRPLTYPACRFLLSPALIRSCSRPVGLGLGLEFASQSTRPGLGATRFPWQITAARPASRPDTSRAARPSTGSSAARRPRRGCSRARRPRGPCPAARPTGRRN